MSTTPTPLDPHEEHPNSEDRDTASDIEVSHKASRRGLSRRGLIAGAAGTAVGVAELVPSNGMPQASTWTTLGTMGGPVASSHRAQPANLLMHEGSNAVLIDSGDGAADQLEKIGVDLKKVSTVILSHLHLDHTAGLYGIIGRRLQELIPGQLRIFGPPGTREVVREIVASQTYVADLLKTASASKSLAPSTVAVTEITKGSVFSAGAATVTATTNTHYGFKNGTPDATRFQSLSYRFELPDRSIFYTGDTGPSVNVDQLAAGADLLISEIINPDQALADLRASRPDIPAIANHGLRKHFADQHLTADAVGTVAHRAGVKAVVLTHNPMNDTSIQHATITIAGLYKGPVAFAADLDTY